MCHQIACAALQLARLWRSWAVSTIQSRRNFVAFDGAAAAAQPLQSLPNTKTEDESTKPTNRICQGVHTIFVCAAIDYLLPKKQNPCALHTSTHKSRMIYPKLCDGSACSKKKWWICTDKFIGRGCCYLYSCTSNRRTPTAQDIICILIQFQGWDTTDQRGIQNVIEQATWLNYNRQKQSSAFTSQPVINACSPPTQVTTSVSQVLCMYPSTSSIRRTASSMNTSPFDLAKHPPPP